MEQSLSSLTFRGSIMEAIAEAKQQKKLFVVYISGDNPESHNLAASTWMDSRVAESVSKFCIFIHISEGSADAANFSAIYPQKSAPCTTAVGYNGVQLWQYEGFVAADALSSSIEKAWLSVHIQETTATYLSAALASKKQPASGTSDGTSSEEGSSSRTNELSSPAAAQNYSPEVGPSVNPEIVEENNHLECASEEKLEQLHEATAQSSSANEIACGEVRDEKKVSSHHLEAKEEASSIKITKEGTGTNKVEKDDFLKVSANKSNEVHLNIRLPDGSSLQMKFLVMDTLRMVKDYIDENRTSSFGSYDLAIPYPRKVFGEQDLSKTLQDLDLFGRQTLVLVLHHRANWHPKGESSLHDQTNFIRESSSNEGNDGYWGSLRRILSYLNPISYLSGSTNAEDTTAQESQSRIWQYDPNPSLQNDLQGTGISSGAYRSTDTTNRSSNSRSRQLKSSPFGSNIHTLRHDEDDGRFNDRNAFWNGNSTQYGGDNDGK
ncbi:unnamed protein product [Coffea canephora]|uniref:UBX domain-containing protein n=1 Tax=Coffea canephora TaxID=49390 RepID=A0A068V9E5_COFCA|nr:unnamed protein product [Coffea canephora]